MADSLTVDGKEGMDLTDGERKKVLKRIFGRLEPKDLTEVMKVLIERFQIRGCREKVRLKLQEDVLQIGQVLSYLVQ